MAVRPVAARTLLRRHAEWLVLAALLAGTTLLPGTIPASIYGLGVAAGAALALHAIGIVLVYRSERFINFAQPQLGALAGVLFVHVVKLDAVVLGVHGICPSCVRVREVNGPAGRVTVPVDPPAWLVQTQFWIAVAGSIAIAVALGWLVHVLVVRRFRTAPRLVLAVLTIGLGEVFRLFQLLVPKIFPATRGDGAGGALLPGAVPFPFEWRLSLAGMRLGTNDLLTIGVLVIAAVALKLFLSRSRSGVVMRGAADDPSRAETLGVPVARFHTLSWVLATLLSAVAAVLAASASGLGALGAFDNVARVLAAAVFGALVSVPIAVVAAVVIGVLDQTVSTAFGSAASVDAMLLLFVVVTLLAQRSRQDRVDTDSESGWRATRELRPIPAELRELDVVRRWVRSGTVALVLFLLGLPWLLSPGQTNLAAVTAIFAIVGLSLLVLTGWAGQVSLGHFGIAAVGAYVTALLDWPFPLPLVAGALAASIAAVVVGLPALRLRGMHLAVTTLVFAVAVHSVLLDPRYGGKALPDALERPALLGLDLDDQRTFYYLALAFAGVAVVSVLGMRRSRTARALIAARDNEPAAQSFGINLMRARLGAFAMSGFLAGFAGGLYALSQYGAKPSGFTVDESMRMFLLAVIGGLGSVVGPLLGAAYVGATMMFDNALVALGGTGLGVVLLLLFVPGGLGDLLFRIRDAMLRRVAERYRIDVPSLLEDRRRRGSRAPIAPKLRPGGGGTVFVPVRYRPEGQWAVAARHREAVEAVRD